MPVVLISDVFFAVCVHCSHLQTPTCADEWKREAELRWGDYVKHLEVDDWQGYVTSRMSTPPPPSPLDLLQEYYAHDAWQLLVCCVLMSRVSSWDVKHKVIAAFFEKYANRVGLSSLHWAHDDALMSEGFILNAAIRTSSHADY